MIDFQAHIELKTERVVVRSMKMEDLDALLPMAVEPGMWGYGSADIRTKEDLQAYMKSALEAKEAKQMYPFTFIDRATGQLAGSSRYCNIQPRHERLEIGYTWLGKPFRGTGFNTHVKYGMLEYAFETLGCYRVEFKADTRNHRSLKAMRNIGAVEEGVLRSHSINVDGYRRDTIYFSILKPEWTGVKQKLLAKMAN